MKENEYKAIRLTDEELAKVSGGYDSENAFPVVADPFNTFPVVDSENAFVPDPSGAANVNSSNIGWP